MRQNDCNMRRLTAPFHVVLFPDPSLPPPSPNLPAFVMQPISQMSNLVPRFVTSTTFASPMAGAPASKFALFDHRSYRAPALPQTLLRLSPGRLSKMLLRGQGSFSLLRQQRLLPDSPNSSARSSFSPRPWFPRTVFSRSMLSLQRL
ncbi:unnamed protein product [Dibothriocephalus latus]|uniref:Uncharacterized protein n=1 Tax=Dibothriocephalus latus TaxID=60516 RepID=A0A3P7LRR1_DIBLA|nr:unnamed protein product [Dibothriocephalus latus]